MAGGTWKLQAVSGQLPPYGFSDDDTLVSATLVVSPCCAIVPEDGTFTLVSSWRRRVDAAMTDQSDTLYGTWEIREVNESGTYLRFYPPGDVVQGYPVSIFRGREFELVMSGFNILTFVRQ
jgi:hypothetical protein